MSYSSQTIHGIEVWEVEPSAAGVPRYVTWYGNIPFRKPLEGEDLLDFQAAHIQAALNLTGGKLYKGKWFGDGIVFESENIEKTVGDWFD